jgi:heme exporter protein CcmD
MNSAIEILAMQGYGVYVWGSVFVTLGILVGNFWYANSRFYKTQRKLKENQ